MAKTANDTQTKTPTPSKPVSRPPRSKSLSQKLDELKLGKFCECQPMCLPEKMIDRRWQIIGGISFLLAAIAAIYVCVNTYPVSSILQGSPMSPAAMWLTAPWYQCVVCVMLVIFAISCAMSGIMMLSKKRVPISLRYILIITALVGLICMSFHRFRLYEQRECYKNYPNIIELDYPCPKVIDELSGVVLIDLVVMLVAVVLISWVKKSCSGHKTSK